MKPFIARMRGARFIVVLAAMAPLLFQTSVFAQPPGRGSLRVTVVDQTGAVSRQLSRHLHLR
jgi:hypothetical protein